MEIIVRRSGRYRFPVSRRCFRLPRMQMRNMFSQREKMCSRVLAVQAVGFEEGVDNPKVHIYLTRASRKLLKSIPNEIDGVPVRAHKMGPITVRPEAAASANARGHLFERNDRICCGSSCAPTSENYSGTFGAIVTIKNARQKYLLSIMSFLAAITSRLISRSWPRAVMIVARTLEHRLKSGDISKLTRCGAEIQIL